MQTMTLDSVHPYDWAKVAKKSYVKKVLATITNAGLPVADLYISPAFGSVYIEVGTSWDEDYGWLETRTVRVSSHERTSSNHAHPDVNVYDQATLRHALTIIPSLLNG